MKLKEYTQIELFGFIQNIKQIIFEKTCKFTYKNF